MPHASQTSPTAYRESATSKGAVSLSRKSGGGSLKVFMRLMPLGAMLSLLMLAGCQYTAAPADLLLKPEIGEDKEQLLAAVTKALPEFSILMLPHSNDVMEAVRLIDLDGDGKNEAVVTYYNEYSSPEIMTLRHTDNGWRQWLLVQQPLAREMTWLSIIDMDGDGVMELAVGWAGAFDSPSMLEMYSFSNKAARNDKGKLTMVPAASLPFSLADTADLNRDGKQVLAVISGTSFSGTTAELIMPVFQLAVYTWEDGKLASRAKTTLPEGVNLFERIKMGSISPRHQGILLEGGTGAHSMLTYMYAWNGRDLSLVFPTPEQEKLGYGFAGKPTVSRDMNGDGIIELQRTWEAPGQEGVPYSDSLWITEWLQWDGRNEFRKIAEQYVDESYGLLLDIPEAWQGKYTLEKPPRASYGVVALQYYNPDTAERADLVSIHVVPKNQWDGVEHVWREEKRTFRTLGTYGGNLYAAVLYDETLGDATSLTAHSRAEAEEMLKEKEQFLERIRIEFSE
ncbi:VCBS repeat-containing protein [Paenibacillus sp. PAMC21692]|uniref:FG-GAP repeat domain-containing protein n=1 Tax=Paenibacillus sp. PAMC21692 TaxID=2762320 RepID=UPI00164E24A6|nr:VCBS repeat-containing protein [Paenibacillus sp. PAMC21692]QNK56597.1 VCBS repeat-containing protein [Paenibacillus sp. PAMC21692]